MFKNFPNLLTFCEKMKIFRTSSSFFSNSVSGYSEEIGKFQGAAVTEEFSLLKDAETYEKEGKLGKARAHFDEKGELVVKKELEFMEENGGGLVKEDKKSQIKRRVSTVKHIKAAVIK